MREKITSRCAAVNTADYDAPVAENGDLTEKYFIIQRVLLEMLPNSEGVFSELALMKIITIEDHH